MHINPSPHENINPDNPDQELGDGMQDVIKNYIKRLETPLKADSETTTFEEIKHISKDIYHLSDNTVDHNLRYLKHAELHNVIPLDLRQPNQENFMYHMLYRIKYEGFSVYAEHHLWKAVKMYLRCLGIQPWDYKPRPKPKSRKRILPFPEIAREFWHYKYSKNRITRKLYQYMFFFGFMLGVRIPSELAILKTSDIIFNRNGTAILTITEPKKQQSQRTVILPFELATDPRHKSLKVWMNSWRSKIANEQSEDYLFLQSDGKPWTVRHLGHKLSVNGKLVWKHFHPYDMRHWNAVAHLIEQKVNTGTFDIYPVMNWLGHEKPSTTMMYVKFAEQYYQQAQYSWLKRALKMPKHEDSTLTQKRTPPQKRAVFVFSTGETENGPGEPYCGQQKGKKRTNTEKWPLSVFSSTFFSFFNAREGKQTKTHYEGSQLNFSFIFFSSFVLLQNSEIPLPLNRLLLRARNDFIFFIPPPIFIQNYPSPYLLKQKIYDDEISEESGCFSSSPEPIPLSSVPPKTRRWCNT